MTFVALAPVALGFFGLGTGYLIYGPWEFFGKPSEKTPEINRTLGQWGIWMPGFLQFLAGTYLWLGLTLFPAFQPASTVGHTVLYMAALAFTAFGVHWFALGYNRYKSSDMRVDGYMALSFMWISIMGAFVFLYNGADVPVGILFVLLFFVYLSDAPASLMSSKFWTRIKGFWHIVTGVWLMYLTFAAVANLALGIALWV
ncbi:MAG: hypothetical protein M1476_07035 [Candidatus Thermoplasmatota archaeon]|nr:hypothetical protein [Candidatus Thermoplasmatota archaeon]